MTNLQTSLQVVVFLRDTNEKVIGRIAFTGDILLHVEVVGEGKIQMVVMPWTSISKILVM